MHHYSTKQPPKYAPFLAYVLILTEYRWYVCRWDIQQRLYVDSVLGKDIGTDYYWTVDLPTPTQLMAATRLISQLEPIESAQLQTLMKEVLIY